jgi:hypothetical protein
VKRKVFKVLGVTVAMVLLLVSLKDGAQAQSPGIDIKKYTNGLNADLPPGPEIPAGDEVTWDYVVANTGDTVLTDVAVTDDKGVPVTCPATTLEIGASMICSATGIATEGQYENTGTVEAVYAESPESNIVVTDSDISHYLGAAPRDGDGDGIPDDADQCRASSADATVIIDGCDTGVENKSFDTGCKMSDLIAQCAAGAKNHGKFVSCVAGLTNGWMKTKLISGRQKGSIQVCAAKADIP